MARRSSVDGKLRSLLVLGLTGGLDDRALLARFARDRDLESGEEAFRVLVERHGPMVFRVCRQVIGNAEEAEDATQAVFLVLVRRARSIRVNGTLAPWLHGVARRVALRARTRGASRRRLELLTAGTAAALRSPTLDGRQSSGEPDAGVIYEEVDRLSEKYRAPVVLCYLQGQTYEQAAERIGCPIGTVRVRLSRAREQLRSRLRRRGFGPEHAGAIFAIEPGSLAVEAGPTFGAGQIETIVRAVKAFHLGSGALSETLAVSVLHLYQGATRTMMIKQAMIAAACTFAVVGIGGLGAIGLAHGMPGQGQGDGAVKKQLPAAATAPPIDASEDAPLKALEKQIKKQEPFGKQEYISTFPKLLEQDVEWQFLVRNRVDACADRYKKQSDFFNEGRISIDRVIDASRQLMLAVTAQSETKERRITALEAHLDRMQELVKREQALKEAARGTDADLSEAEVAVQVARSELAELRHSGGASEIELLKERVGSLEKQLEAIKEQLKEPAARE